MGRPKGSKTKTKEERKREREEMEREEIIRIEEERRVKKLQRREEETGGRTGGAVRDNYAVLLQKGNGNQENKGTKMKGDEALWDESEVPAKSGKGEDEGGGRMDAEETRMEEEMELEELERDPARGRIWRVRAVACVGSPVFGDGKGMGGRMNSWLLEEGYYCECRKWREGGKGGVNIRFKGDDEKIKAEVTVR